MTLANRCCLALLAIFLLALSAAATPAMAQQTSPFGAGPARQEQPRAALPVRANDPGTITRLLAWVYTQQQRFHRALTDGVKRFKTDPAAIWLLLGLSFAYGVFHAAGPGHGKAVLSSYMLANETQVKRGIALAFAAAVVQALTAVLLVTVLAMAIRTTGLMINRTANYFETASYALIVLIGLWLVWAKGRQFLAQFSGRGGHGHAHGHGHGHAHMADPSRLSGRLSISKAVSLVFAMGLRPCSGAVLVLLFTFVQGVFMAGVAAAFIMAVGTGLTVAVLAVLALGSKRLVTRLVGTTSPTAIWTMHGVEMAAALLVLLLGATLLAAALTSGSRPF